MLRIAVRTTLAGVLLVAGLMASSPVAADDCPHCRAQRPAGRGYLNNVMGSVAYQDRAEHGEGYAGNPYATRHGRSITCRDRSYPQPDLFYNYYAHGPCGGYPAQLYLSPKPVPAHVGHTYITYQPLMPHEFLYKHDRTYHQYYDGGRGLTRTSVVWK